MVGKKTHIFLSEKFPDMPDILIKEICKQRSIRLYGSFNTLKLIHGIKKLLVFLKSKKYVIALTTGSERNFAEKVLKINLLDKYFDIITSGEEFSSSKPNTECYKITLKKLNLVPLEAIVIEDSSAGIIAAKKIRCKVFAVKTYLSSKLLIEADKIFDNHTDILSYFKKSKKNCKWDSRRGLAGSSSAISLCLIARQNKMIDQRKMGPPRFELGTYAL